MDEPILLSPDGEPVDVSWFRWDRVTEEMRPGWVWLPEWGEPVETPCWIAQIGARWIHDWYRLFELTVAPRAKGMIYGHLCEHHVTRSYCIRPSHRRVITPSENSRHRDLLRGPMPQVLRDRISAGVARVRAERGDEINEQIRQTTNEMRVCADCGVAYNRVWMTRHRNDGKCIIAKP